MSAPHILVVDDEADIRGLLKEILSEEGYEVDVAANAAQARASRARQTPDLVLLDIWMPDVDGITLLREWSASVTDGCPVVMMSGHGTVETAVEATRLGAFDFVEKPLSLAKLLRTVERALDAGRRRRQSGKLLVPALMMPAGKSKLMQQLRTELQQIASHSSSVLLIGEPGCRSRSVREIPARARAARRLALRHPRRQQSARGGGGEQALRPRGGREPPSRTDRAGGRRHAVPAGDRGSACRRAAPPGGRARVRALLADRRRGAGRAARARRVLRAAGRGEQGRRGRAAPGPARASQHPHRQGAAVARLRRGRPGAAAPTGGPHSRYGRDCPSAVSVSRRRTGCATIHGPTMCGN